MARLRRRHRLVTRGGRAAADRLPRRRRLDPAAERRAVVVGRDRAGLGLGAARRRRAGRSTPFELAQTCQRAENAYVGVQSGLMDQFAEACGVAGAARPPRLPVVRVAADPVAGRSRARRLPHGIRAAPRSLGVQHRGGASARRRWRRSPRAIPAIHSLRDVTPRAARDVGGRAWTPIAARRAEHVVSENARVGATVAALAAGDLAAVGALFAASHASLRDDCSRSARRSSTPWSRSRGASPAWSPRG